MIGPSRRPSRGTALLVVLAILAILSTLAVSFARVTSLEGEASIARVEAVRARFLAFAGVERAKAAIRIAAQRHYDGPDVPWFYRGQSGQPAGNGISLGEAALPSYQEAGLAFGRPYSGSLPQTWEPLGDTYVLKILDAASKIDLNAPADSRLADAQQPLVRMLTNLGLAIDAGSPPITAADAEMVFAHRQTLPGAVFLDPRELLEVPGLPISDAEFADVADFLTTHAWADSLGMGPMDPALVPAEGADVYGRVPTGSLLRMPRRPVNVNTAPAAVLIAIFAGLQALRIETDVSRSPAGDTNWQRRGQATRTTAVSLAQAGNLASSICTLRETQPFKCWADFDSWLAGRVTAGTVDAYQGAAIRANVDPNIDTHRANPDLVAWKEIDKFDLVASTTELCFHSNGIFEIESYGRVTNDGGTIQAEARVWAAVEVFQLVRQSVQSQFIQGTFGEYTLIEPILYLPESAVIVEEDCSVDGGPEILGTAGSVHSNSNLDMTGNPHVAKDATATGNYSESNQTIVDGTKGGGFPRITIPSFNPTVFRGMSDIIFGADGVVVDRAGNVLGNGLYGGFTLFEGTWSWSGGAQPSGILFFEGNLKMTANTNGAWVVTLVTTGFISIKGKPNMSPSVDLRLTIIAGTDVTITGTPGASIAGVVYAGEQMDLGGNTDFYGAALAKGNGRVDSTVTSNKIHGSVIFHYNKDIDPIPYDWVYTDLPTVMTYPEPDARATVGGNLVDLPSIADYDGWLELAPATINRSYLGGNPYTDRMLARWKDGTLDAEFGGGSLAMTPDLAGPLVGPLVGEPLCGHLMPDGCFSEWDAIPAFAATDNIGPLVGSIAFWIKPSWDVAKTTRTHHLFSMSRTDEVGTQSFQFARTGDWTGTWGDTTGFHFERSTVENPRADRLVHSTWAPPAHAWTHVVLVYDFTSSTSANAIKIWVDGVEMPNSIYEFTSSYDLDANEQGRSSITPANLIRLGERIVNAGYQLPPGSAEATYDELFCQKVAVDSTWVASMYGDGRFYSYGLADYLSTSLSNIPVDSEILNANWTLRTPAGWNGPAPTVNIEEGGVAVATSTDPSGFAIGRRVAGDTKYRIQFLGAATAALYTSPVIDEVTVVFAQDPRVLTWEE